MSKYNSFFSKLFGNRKVPQNPIINDSSKLPNTVTRDYNSIAAHLRGEDPLQNIGPDVLDRVNAKGASKALKNYVGERINNETSSVPKFFGDRKVPQNPTINDSSKLPNTVTRDYNSIAAHLRGEDPLQNIDPDVLERVSKKNRQNASNKESREAIIAATDNMDIDEMKKKTTKLKPEKSYEEMLTKRLERFKNISSQNRPTSLSNLPSNAKKSKEMKM